MRVLILSTMYPNSRVFLSGVFVHEQVKALINKGTEVIVIAPVPLVLGLFSFFSKKWRSYSKILKFETIDGVPVYHTKYIAVPKGIFKSYWSYSYFFFLRKLAEKLHNEKKFDVIHAHGTIPNDHAALLLSRYLNIPYVVTVHGETVYKIEKHPGRYKNSVKALNNAQAVIGVSSVINEKIREITKNVKRIYKIYNGFIPSPQTSSKRSSYNSTDRRLIILFAATLYERKGCLYLLKAFKILYNEFSYVELLIAGGGPQFSKLKNFTISLGIADKVKFTGSIPHYKMMLLMSECDIFILPSWDEAFGVVYLEAMSYKKPIIATFGEGITDIVRDGINGLLVKPKDVDSIVEKLRMLIESKELRVKLGNAGYESIKHLTWEKSASEVLNVYNDILNK